MAKSTQRTKPAAMKNAAASEPRRQRAATVTADRVKPRSETDERSFRPQECYSPSDAKAWLLAICSDLTDDGAKRAYVGAGPDRWVMTLDPVDRHRRKEFAPYIRGPVLDVPITRFKTDFARYWSFIKFGKCCFRLTRRGAPPVYARRCTNYVDPLDPVMEIWVQRMVDERVHRLSEAVEKFTDVEARLDWQTTRLEMDLDEVKEAQKQDRRAILRSSLNLPPYTQDPTRPHSQPLGISQPKE